MHILFLTQIIPYPPDAGPRVKTWHVLRYLSELGHHVFLASFIRPEEEQYIPTLEKVCKKVYTVPITRSRLHDAAYWLRSQISRRPFLIERDDLVAMRNCVDEIVSTQAIDIIHADQLSMTQFAQTSLGSLSSGRKPMLIFDAHNAVWTIVEQMIGNVPWILRPILMLEAQRVKYYEGKIVNSFDHTFTVSEIDRQYMLDAKEYYLRMKHVKDVNISGNGKAISVIPIAVDTKKLLPVIRNADTQELFTMGTLHYPPNADGIRWFVQEVFPLIKEKIPSATLTIAGRNPPADFFRFEEASAGAIKVTGFVPELTPHLERSAAMVVPVRAGSGMRVRILEGFAQAMPIVTTTVGLEGIQAKHGEEVMVADTPVDFANCVVELLGDVDMQRRLARNSRLLAETIYDWKVVLKQLEPVYES